MPEESDNTEKGSEPQPKDVPAQKKSVCPECKSNQIEDDKDLGETVCRGCGIVISEKGVNGGYASEPRIFGDKGGRVRTGSPSTYRIHDKGLPTVIDWRNKTRSGRQMTPEQSHDMNRLRKWQTVVRVQSAEERNLAVALGEMTKTAGNLNLPKAIHETGSVIYRRALKKKMIRGRSIVVTANAALYAACRVSNFTRTLDDFAHDVRKRDPNIGKKGLGRVYRFLIKEGIVQELVDEGIITNVKLPPYVGYATRICNKLKTHYDGRETTIEEERIANKTERMAIRILEVAKEMKLLGGRATEGMPAAAVYIASKMCREYDPITNRFSTKYTQREIAEIAKVTEVTIRNRYKEMMVRLFIEVPM